MSTYKAKISIEEAKKRHRGYWYASDQQNYEHPGRGKYTREISQYFIDAYDMKTGEKIETAMAFGVGNMKQERARIYSRNKHRRYRIKVYNQTRKHFIKG